MEPAIDPPFKLGRHEPGLGVIEHRFDNVFATGGSAFPEGLAIACGENHVRLVADILRLFPGPFRVVYVLLVPFAGYSEGRYEFSDTFDHEEVAAFLAEYRPYFEQDARHHLVIEDAGGVGEVTYDQHNFICVTGPTEDARRMLLRQGFVPGEVRLPIPHSHHHHGELDGAGEKMLSRFAWRLRPLLESD